MEWILWDQEEVNLWIIDFIALLGKLDYTEYTAKLRCISKQDVFQMVHAGEPFTSLHAFLSVFTGGVSETVRGESVLTIILTTVLTVVDKWVAYFVRILTIISQSNVHEFSVPKFLHSATV